MTYFVVEKPTPLLNTPCFRKVFGHALPFDKQKLVREVEMIALPGMVFEVIQSRKNHILEVKTCRYLATKLFIDQRFGQLQKNRPPLLMRKLPPKKLILERMKKCVGLPYVWGGNYAAGIPEWKNYYPPEKPLSEIEEAHWCFRGVDCSGLLYEAAEGCVPRNTSEQIKMGVEVSINSLKPLDLVFSPGHVFILLNQDEVIESRLKYGGVTITPLKERLKELDCFVIKRFHPETISFQKS